MRSCCMFDSLRLLHFPLFAVYLLSYRPVFPSGHQLHLPRCGGQNSLCTSANDDFGTLAEYDPLTPCILRWSVSVHHKSDVLERNGKNSHHHVMILFRSTHDIVGFLAVFHLGITECLLRHVSLRCQSWSTFLRQPLWCAPLHPRKDLISISMAFSSGFAPVHSFFLAGAILANMNSVTL